MTSRSPAKLPGWRGLDGEGIWREGARLLGTSLG